MNVEPGVHNKLWYHADNPLLKRGDNFSVYSTQAPLGIIRYTEMRTQQKTTPRPNPTWNA